jgi:thiamine pyrophosphate-dependent acetolactate synthase large subunit-like protein
VASSSPTITVDHEGAPPAKRRRVAKPREPKKTEYLDLQALNESDNKMTHEKEDPKLRKLVDALRNKSKIVVIAGAGISTAAGSM